MFTAIIVILTSFLILAVIYIFLTMPRVFDSANMDLLATDYAHRGLHSDSIPENSLSAFSAALDKTLGIEIDVQLSTDGEIFVFHDKSVARMCGVKKDLTAMTAEEIKQLRLLGTEEQVPTLNEVLKLVDGRVPLLIEIKYHAHNEKLCEALAEVLDGYIGSFAIQSFDPRILRYFKKHRPRFARGQLVSKTEKRSKGKPSSENQHPIVSFALSHLLLNFLSRPDFISIQKNHTRDLGFILATEAFKAKGFIWTVKNEKQYNYFKRQGHSCIFEGFLPE